MASRTDPALGPKIYAVQARDRAPLIDFILAALVSAGCRIIHHPPADEAPFRITFETPTGERMGIVAYAYLATFTPTKNRPEDEHSFQIKYGSKDGKEHDLWQDPFGLYTTLLLGINPESGFFVAADPVLHSPTKFFIRVEFKQHHVDEVFRRKWHAWERVRRSDGEPVEVLVGGTAAEFLRLVRFERDAIGEDQGHRQLLAEKAPAIVASRPVQVSDHAPPPTMPRLHELAREFEMSEAEVLDLIAKTRRLKMAVRGWVAEQHLVRVLGKVPGVTECARLEGEGGPDLTVRYEGGRPLLVECKNVLRDRTKDGTIRLDFQRTRASINDPCSRYYAPEDFDIVAACLHSVTERWEFRYTLTDDMDPHRRCPAKLASNVHIDERWKQDATQVLKAATEG